MSREHASVVLAHGAWADGSSWNDVTRPLQAQGITVIAAPLPLTSLSDDVAGLDRAIARTEGPVVLAAHAYAGAVISATKSDRVKALAYIAALTPDEGETVADVFYREAPHPDAPQLAPDAEGFIWMPDTGFKSAFAQHARNRAIGAVGGHAKADQCRLHSGTLAKTCVAIDALLVPGRGGRSHDQPQDPALHGGANGGKNPL